VAVDSVLAHYHKVKKLTLTAKNVIVGSMGITKDGMVQIALNVNLMRSVVIRGNTRGIREKPIHRNLLRF